MQAVTTVNRLIYKHFVYQEDVIEGNTDPMNIRQAYERWSQWCVITVITPKYIKIEMPDKSCTSGRPVSCYTDYKILKGLWLACSDYGNDIDQFFWCRNRLQALVKKWIFGARCSGPYLINTIDLRCLD